MSYPSENLSYHHQPSGKDVNHIEAWGFGEYINLQKSIHPNPKKNNYNSGFDASGSANSMMEQMSFYHQNMKPMNQKCKLPVIQQNQIEQQLPAARHRISGNEDVLVVELEPSLFNRGKPRVRWTLELHERFLRAVSELGGLFSKYQTIYYVWVTFEYFYYNVLLFL